MRIKEVVIYGFGKWVDYSIDLTKQPLVCIFGENESGKSTLQQFILFILFGLPPRKRNFYRPKTSGKMGGRLTVEDPVIGEYTIERLDEVNNGAATCYTKDGLEHDEQWLKNQLKGMTSEMYEAIYSFSALDLKKIRQMKADDLGEVLLGIGLTGSTEVYALEKSLDTTIGNYFKPYGKNPVINEQLNKLDELLDSLHSFSKNEATYREKQQDKMALSTEIKQLQTDLKSKKDMVLTIEKQQHALPIINEYQTYKEEWKTYPSEIIFPTNGLGRLQKLKEAQLPLSSEIAILKGNQKNLKVQIIKLEQQLLPENILKDTEAIILEKQVYIENKNKQIKYKEEIIKKQHYLQNRLKELNINLTVNDLSSIAIPFYSEQSWGEIKNSAERLKLEQDQHQLEYASLNKQREAFLDEMNLIKDNILTDEQLESLHDKQYNYDQQVTMDERDQQEQWQRTKQNKQKRMKAILIGSIPISIIVVLSAVLFKLPVLYLFFAMILFFGVSQWIWGNRSIKETESILFYKHVDEESTEKVSSEEKQKIDQLLENHNNYDQTNSMIQSQLKLIDIQLIKWNEKSTALNQQTLRLNERVQEYRDSYPFLIHVDPLYWSELYYAIKELIDEKQQLLRLEREQESLQREKIKYEQVLRDVFQRNKNEVQDYSPPDMLNNLEKMLEQHRYAIKSIEHYQKEIKKNIGQLEELEQKLALYNDEITALFKVAKVSSEEEYYNQAKQLENKQIIQDGMKKTNRQLTMIFPETVKEQLLNDKLDEQTLELGHKQAKTKITKIENTINQKNQQLAKVIVDINHMETSESHSKTIHQFNMERDYLAELVHEWAVVKTAKEMLTKTKRSYRNKYLKQVIETTSAYFRLITNDAYKHVFAPTAERLFQVEASTGTRYDVKELSEGTVDQLYISLRLAISERMSKQHHLPFIIDDAFVHFDAKRTNQVLKLLAKISKKQQVILFTCKKEIVQTLQSSDIIYLEQELAL